MLLFGFAAATLAADHSALDRFIGARDLNYKYELVRTIPGQRYTAYVLHLTSQKWRSAEEVNRPIWRHWLTIVKPENVRGATGFLFITGGSVTDKAPTRTDPFMAKLAIDTGTVVSELRDVPNEPLTFAGEDHARTEDGIIAYTWDKYLRTGDETWPLHLPMAKSAVKAMDAITSFMRRSHGTGAVVKQFVVAGASKRGWTTWLTAAADKRVVAIIPLVIDVLNSEKNIDHQFRAYGFLSPALDDYVKMGLLNWAGTPQYQALMNIEDPYSYLDRLTVPKYIINASGDQYFLPDSSQFYWNDLLGEKHLRYVPNAKHDLAGTDVSQSIEAFYGSVVKGTERPNLTWSFEADGSIRVKTVTRPSEVKLWQATNPTARDFRVDSIGHAYTSTPLKAEGEGVYTAKVLDPPKGWTAFFIEMTYPMGGSAMKVTTGVRVTPDVLPYGPAPKSPPPCL
ncbi:MAG: PhoPQ-activated pathogenicity-related family protein [Bryobacteraceae bacterium]